MHIISRLCKSMTRFLNHDQGWKMCKDAEGRPSILIDALLMQRAEAQLFGAPGGKAAISSHDKGQRRVPSCSRKHPRCARAGREAADEARGTSCVH